MKKFKIAELALNITLILYFSIRILLTPGMNELLTGYFVIGSTQVIGMVIHRMFNCFTNKYSRRYIYNWITFITIALVPTGSILYFLLIAGAPMALYYTIQCTLELRKINRREFIHLKN